MKDVFDRYGVELVAISMDTVEQAASMRVRDDLWCTLLADPELKVIDQYGLVNRSVIAKTWWVLGLPIGMVAGKKQMAIPTSILLSENGTVKWIDQSDDYRIRADRARVERALDEAFQPLESAGMQSE